MTIFKAPAIYKNMSGMFRFASAAMMLMYRLVIVVSLAGYSMSTVNAAMHPDQPKQGTQFEMDHGSHQEDQSVMSATDHHSDQHDHADSKSSKKSCCQDYCGVVAINCGNMHLKHPLIEPVLAYLSDAHYVGQAPTIHLPPDI